MLSNQPVVIDNGSGVLKAGFAGGDRPRVVVRSIAGAPKHVRFMPGGAMEGTDLFLGSRAEEHRGALLLQYPMERGIVKDWSTMEKLWRHVYSREHLSAIAEEHPVLLTEAPLNPYANRIKAAEILLEGFRVPALYVAPQAILSLYASGRTTGVVLDSGDGVTHAVAVYEGFAMPHATTRLDVAGRDVTQHMKLLLRRGGYNLDTSAEFEIVREVKENCCYVTFNPAKDEIHSSQQSAQYTLPDGNIIQLGSEAWRAPEILFHPELIGSEERGVHDCLVRCVMRCDTDLRRTLYANMVLAGGNTMFPGFGDRLLNEVRKHSLSPKDMKIRIAASPERMYSTWIGGSILASLATFKSMWVSKAEYDEHGASVLFSRGM